MEWKESDTPDNVWLYDTLTLAKIVADKNDPELQILVWSGYPVGIKQNLAER